MFTQIRATLRHAPDKACFKLKGSHGPYYWMTADELIALQRTNPVTAGSLVLDLDHEDVANLNKLPNVVISTKGLLAQLFG